MLDKAAQYVDVRTVVTFSAVLLAAVWYFRSSKKKYKLPPQPFTLPLLGNMYQLMTAKKRICEHFFEMSNSPEYGPVFTIQIATFKFVVLNNLQVVKEAFIDKPVDFADRPEIFSLDLFSGGGKDILVGRYGPVWKFHKKVGYAALRNFGSGKKLETVAHSAGEKVMALMANEGSRPYDARPHIVNLVFNLLCGVCFNKEYEIDDPEFRSFINLTKEALDTIGSGLPPDYIPWLKHVPLPQVNKFKSMMAPFMTFLWKNYNEHKERYDPDNLEDLTDYLMHTKQQAEEEETHMKGVLDEERLVMTVMDIFGAGIDTLVNTLLWALVQLMENPDKQAKLQQEIDEVLGDQLPGLDSKNKLPYTEACMYEIMRYSTITLLGIPLATTCDTTVGGYDIPKGMTVMVNMWAMHNDPSKWDEPDKFKPERFLDESGKVVLRNESFMAFSHGKRICMGEQFAKNILMLALPMLFQRFQLVPPPGVEKFHVEAEDSPLGNVPKDFQLVSKLRM